jgi:hypothetical protein
MSRFDDRDVADLLYAASDHAPPSRVDLDAVVCDGRRRRWRRVAAPVLAAAAVFAVGVGVVVAADIRLPGRSSVPPASSGPDVSATSTVAPTEFPLDRQLFALGHTAGHELTAVNLALHMQHLQYGDPLGNGVSLQVYAAGADAQRLLVEGQYEHVAAPAVNGMPASYLYGSTGEGPRLAGITFRWAASGGALLFHDPGAGDEAVLVQVAASLRTDVGQPARFGLRVSSPPGLRLVQTTPFALGADGPGLFSGVRFDFGEGSVREPSVDGPTVSVRVDFDDVRWVSEGEPMVPNTTLGGRPAYVQDDTQGPARAYHVWLLDDGRPAVSVSVYGEGAVDRFGPEQANALALSVQALGTWDDRSQWTDDPVR